MTGPRVVCRGSYDGGLSWQLRAVRYAPADEPGAQHLRSMLRIIAAEGMVLFDGGAGGPALPPGALMNVSTGGGDQGPYALIARVHPSVQKVEVVAADGHVRQVPVFDSVDFPEVRFAVALLPRDLRLAYVLAIGEHGEELERFDLAFHQEVWHHG